MSPPEVHTKLFLKKKEIKMKNTKDLVKYAFQLKLDMQ